MYNISGLNSVNTAYKANTAGITAPKSNSMTPSFGISSPMKPETSFKSQPNFSANQIRTSLSTKEEQEKYNTVTSLVDKKVKKELNTLLKQGKLLSSNSNDNSTVLDNLHKIATVQRVQGLEKTKIIEEVITTITHPFNITQRFGDVPVQMQNELIQKEQADGKTVTAGDLDVKSSTCPAASIEFNLAHKMPAEFARMAEGLTSENVSVTKKLKVDELSQNLMDTIWMLNEFNTEHKMDNWKDLTVTLKPDKNAIIRAKIQNSHKDPGERSIIDVLMQSTFMNIGAQNTYDSLIDRRTPKYNDDNSGLIDIEKNFAEELATGHGKVCVTYQKIDDNGKLVGYECERQETLQHIQNTLNGGDNVIIGYTYCDKDNNVVGGHEITILGIETDKKGNKYFVCNDTDDGVSDKIKYPVEELLPKIHHAGIPKSVLVDNVEFVEGWKELMQAYKDAKNQNTTQNASAPQSLVQMIPVRTAS